MGICNSCNYGKNHICPEQNVYRTVCSFKDPNRKTKKEIKMMDLKKDTETIVKKDTETIAKKDEVQNEPMENMKILRRKDVAICDDYKAGMTIAEIATKYNLHRSTIPRILKKCDVPLRNSKPYVAHTNADKISQETIEAVFKEFERQTIAKDISKKYGLTLYRIGQLKKQWRKQLDNPVVENKVVDHKEEEVIVVENKPEPRHYIYYSGKSKPSAMFAPAELNEELIWAAKIKSLDDIFAVADEAGISTYEVKDGNLFASGQIVLTSGGITINPTAVAEAVNASISQTRTHAIV